MLKKKNVGNGGAIRDPGGGQFNVLSKTPKKRLNPRYSRRFRLQAISRARNQFLMQATRSSQPGRKSWRNARCKAGFTPKKPRRFQTPESPMSMAGHMLQPPFESSFRSSIDAAKSGVAGPSSRRGRTSQASASVPETPKGSRTNLAARHAVGGKSWPIIADCVSFSDQTGRESVY